MASAIDVIMAGVPWLPRALAAVYAQMFIDTGDPELSKQAMRQSPVYEDYFAGNKRDDGTVRYEEEIYLGITESFDDALLGININPSLFRDQYGELIAGLVSPSEFSDRIDTVYERVLTASEQMKQYYSESYGIGMTTEALVASVLNPDIGQRVLENRLAISEIGGHAAFHDFGIDLDLATKLEQQGVTGQSAGSLFAEAASTVPILDVLARRHNDPDDQFDLNDFLSASVFGDPEERLKVRRLLARERSTFSQSTGFARDGRAITGLDAY